MTRWFGTGVILLLVCLVASPLPGAMVSGRLSHDQRLLQRGRVMAYDTGSLSGSLKGEAFLSSSSDATGTYRLELPAGSYLFLAELKGDESDYFGFAAQNPIELSDSETRWVDIALAPVAKEEPEPVEGSLQLSGQIRYNGALLEYSYLYLYEHPEDIFRGPGSRVVPVKDGHFRVRLPEGNYYLVARKRQQGGMYGPLSVGDYFGYYHRNPVRIEPGQATSVVVETIRRSEPLESPAFSEAPHGLRGRVVDAGGNPVEGIYVLAYGDASMKGRGEMIFGPSTSDGRLRLSLPSTRSYFLLARQNLGGPLKPGELWGRWGEGRPEEIRWNPAESKEITFHVAPYEGE